MDDTLLPRMRAMIAEAHVLAASENVLVRIAGERVSAILADVLYEIDLEADEIISLMPPARRAAGAATGEGR